MKLIIFILGILYSGIVLGQDSKTTEFLSEISKYNIAHLWTLNRFQIENDTIIADRKEPLGFIGKDFQRFYIHFISAIQNPSNKLEYFIYGKTKVKNNICTFQGKIEINDARIYIESDFPPLKQGYIKGTYNFFEDNNQKGAGQLTGTFKTYLYFDNQGKIKYDALIFVADGFCNNQFEGTWISYKSGESKKCNWGDYRIPDSNELDCGAAEFLPVEKYRLNGWQDYFNNDNIKDTDNSNTLEYYDNSDSWWK